MTVARRAQDQACAPVASAVMPSKTHRKVSGSMRNPEKRLWADRLRRGHFSRRRLSGGGGPGRLIMNLGIRAAFGFEHGGNPMGGQLIMRIVTRGELGIPIQRGRMWKGRLRSRQTVIQQKRLIRLGAIYHKFTHLPRWRRCGALSCSCGGPEIVLKQIEIGVPSRRGFVFGEYSQAPRCY